MRLPPAAFPGAALLAAVLLSSPAAAQAPRSIAECERLKGDLAYNQCLASFGPRQGERAPRANAAVDPGDAEEAPAVAPRRGRRGAAAYRRGSRGRQSATFEVGRRSRVTGAPIQTRRSYRRRR